MKLFKQKICKCDKPFLIDFDPTTCWVCKGRVLAGLKLARQYDRDNKIIRDKNGVKTNRKG